MKRGVLAQDYLTWRGLVTIVRQKSAKYIRNDSNEEDKPLVNSYKEIIISSKPQLFEKIKGKQIKYVFTERALHQVKYKNKIYYNAIYGQTISSNWDDIFKMPYIMPVYNCIRDLQYKILFRIMATNKLLYQMRIKNNPNCPICLLSVHTVEHLFYECHTIKNFWVTLTCMWKMHIHNKNFNIGLSDVIFGYNLQYLKGNKSLNTVILQAKYYIYKSFLNEKAATIMGFLSYLDQYINIRKKLKITCEKHILDTLKSFVTTAV